MNVGVFVVVFVVRLAAAAAIVGLQLYFINTYGVLDGFFSAAKWQLIFQIGAMIVAPPGAKMWVAGAAGFCAIIIGVVLIVAVVTVVVPIATIIATMQGDYSFIFGGLAALAFIALSAGVVAVGAILDDLAFD